MNRIKRVLSMAMAIMLLAIAVSPVSVTAKEKTYVLTSIDVPGSTFTQAFGINAGGEIVGNFKDATGKQHGFRLIGGEFNTIDYPGTLRSSIATAIGPGGDIVGQYQLNAEDATMTHGYLLTKNGEWIPVDYPGGHLMTGPFRILPDGTIVGCVHDNPLPAGMHGFVIGTEGMSLFDQPSSMHMGGTPNGKTLVGYYTATNATGGYGTGARTRGYILDNGNFTPFDVPNSKLTQAMDINPGGVVVGTYTDLAGIMHGFLVETRGLAVEDWEFTTIDFPGTTVTMTHLRGINAGGDIVGDYVAGGKVHGFMVSRTGR